MANTLIFKAHGIPLKVMGIATDSSPAPDWLADAALVTGGEARWPSGRRLARLQATVRLVAG